MYGKDEMKIFFQMLAKNYPRGIAECLDIYLSVGKYADMSMFIQDGLDMFRFLLDE
ncbi:MAG: hypothetical protein H6767_00395 [Candidatus Peribacteria bacterium]|nr:MAG: hypothetical protein H6767_00395 [Candidatus Peribacteria bacterium]